MEYFVNLKEGDICPVCGKWNLELVPADDLESIYPNGGWDKCLFCERCGFQIEIKDGKFQYESEYIKTHVKDDGYGSF